MLAFLFNGIGIPVATTGLVYPVWAMVAMAVGVTSIFLNSLWGHPSLFLDAVLSVGRAAGPESARRPGLTRAGQGRGTLSGSGRLTRRSPECYTL